MRLAGAAASKAGETDAAVAAYERAIALGGATTIHSQPGKGTRVTVELPRSDR